MPSGAVFQHPVREHLMVDFQATDTLAVDLSPFLKRVVSRNLPDNV
jgi:hypothetical protein